MSFEKLTWGVKASFRNYVEAAGGSITLSDGATRREDGAFEFAAAAGGDLSIASDGSASGALRFLGTVVFDAHGGMLQVTLTELGLEADADGLVLTAPQAPRSQDRCAIAKLDRAESDTGGGVSFRAEITLDGMFQIADNYPPGTELDPVQLD